jgi:hypothetical protein
MSLGIARVVMKEEGQVRKFMDQVFALRYFHGEEQNVTSPEAIEEVWLKLIEFSGKVDPLKEIKNEQNRKALAIYPEVKELVLKSKDPLFEATKLAIAGNSMDAMTDVQGETSEEVIKKWQRLEIDRGKFNELKERLRQSQRVTYLGDNCGEIVFDRILMEVLLTLYDVEITFVTRSLPILNDATLEDALSVGIGEVTHVIENGIAEPLPGTFLKRMSSGSKNLIEGSDLVISKGGGNYDSLTEEEGLRGKISFLFLAKCYPYCQLHQVSLGVPVIDIK